MKWIRYSDRLPTQADGDADGMVFRARMRNDGSWIRHSTATYTRIPTGNLSEFFWLEGFSCPRPASEEYWQPLCHRVIPRDDGTVLDLSKPLGVRGYSGLRVRIFTFEAEGRNPIIGQYKVGASWTTSYWDARGYSSGGHSSDLINIAMRYEATFWVNYYADGSVRFFSTKLEADADGRPGRVACSQVTTSAEQGEGIAPVQEATPIGDTRHIDLSEPEIEIPF